MEYLVSIKDSLISIYAAARDTPTVFFPIFFIGLGLIWVKWRLVEKGAQRAAKDTYAGWVTDGTEQYSDFQSVLVMKPIKFLKLSLGILIFFGGGAVFFWLSVLHDPETTTKDWAAFVIMILFSVIGLWALWFSFTRIMLYPDRIERVSFFTKRFVAPLSAIKSVQPISKTVAGGIYITFNDRRRLRVIPRMSGYRQLLERLSAKDAKLQLLTKHYSKQAQEAL